MKNFESRPTVSAVGAGIVISRADPNVVFKTYLADRPGYASGMQAAELVVDVSLTLEQRLQKVWPIFSDFNRWMDRYGYTWSPVPGESEDSYVYLKNRNIESGAPVTYIVRKVIAERLLYLDSAPAPIPDHDGVWSGHNVFSLAEAGLTTKIDIFMEHTFYSQTMSSADLRKVAQAVVDNGLIFWRDYFIRDLTAAVSARAPVSGY